MMSVMVTLLSVGLEDSDFLSFFSFSSFPFGLMPPPVIMRLLMYLLPYYIVTVTHMTRYLRG